MSTVYALWLRNIKAYVRDRTLVVISIIFPFFFIYVFNAIFKNEFIENPVTHMLAGVIVSNTFDVALRISSSTITDMSSGFMKEVLVSPVTRVSIAAGQFLSSATVATMQGLLILFFGFFAGFRVTSAMTIVYCIIALIIIGIIFSGLGLFIATKTKNTQTFQIVSMAITMPMTFISGAYIPFSLLPKALVVIGYLNPMTYAVALFRSIALEKTHLTSAELISQELAVKIGGFVVTPAISVVFLLLFGLVFLFLSTISFTKTDFSKINRNKNDSFEW